MRWHDERNATAYQGRVKRPFRWKSPPTDLLGRQPSKSSMIQNAAQNYSDSSNSATPAVHLKSDVDLESWLLSGLVITLAVGGFLLTSDRFYHWFLIPVAICGVLTGTDAVAWFRGRLGLYDLFGILGVYGLHFFLSLRCSTLSGTFSWVTCRRLRTSGTGSATWPFSTLSD